MCDGITDLNLTAGLDPRDDVADVACRDLLAGLHVEAEDTDFVSIILLACGDELHMVPLADTTIDDLEVGDDPTEGVEDGVKDQALQWSLRVTLGCRDTLDDRTEDVVDTYPRLTTSSDDLLTLTAKKLDDLIFDFLGHSTWEVYLVDHGDDL